MSLRDPFLESFFRVPGSFGSLLGRMPKMVRMPLFFGSRSAISKKANVSGEDSGEAGGIVVAKFTTIREFARDSKDMQK
jgi:hypothetical protein